MKLTALAGKQGAMLAEGCAPLQQHRAELIPCAFSVQTFDGLDTCGMRLAAEVEQVVRQHPNLQRISFLGHSMGGLLARHAIGEAHASRAAALLIPNTPCL